MREIKLGDKFILTAYIITDNPLTIPTGMVIFKCKENKRTVATKPLNAEGVAVCELSSQDFGYGIFNIIVYYAGDKKNRHSKSQFDFLINIV